MADIKKPTNARHSQSTAVVRTGTVADAQGDTCRNCNANEANHDANGSRFDKTCTSFAPKGQA